MMKLLSAAVIMAVVLSESCGADDSLHAKSSTRQLRERIEESVRWGLIPELFAASHRNFQREHKGFMHNVTPPIHIPEEEDEIVLGSGPLIAK